METLIDSQIVQIINGKTTWLGPYRESGNMIKMLMIYEIGNKRWKQKLLLLQTNETFMQTNN